MTEIPLLGHPLAGAALSAGAFLLGKALYRRFPSPLLNPLVTATLLVILLLEFTPWSMAQYQEGGRLITLFLAPATVALALPLYRQRHLLRRHGLVILASVTAGSATALLSVWGMARLLDLPRELLLSFLPKSVTTPIAVEIAASLGGIPALTVMAVVFTGIIGALTAPLWLKILRIKDPLARGVAIGTAAHALGTATALERDETEGAMSSLSIGLAGLITAGIALFL